MGSILEMWGESQFLVSEWGALLVFLVVLRMWRLATHELLVAVAHAFGSYII